MIQLSAQTRILVARDPVDFRNGIDGISCLCRQKLGEEPLSGTVFVFTNRIKTQVRLLFYDGQGFWQCTKRLSKGRFRSWPREEEVSQIFSEQFFPLLRRGSPSGARGMGEWRPIA